MMFVMESILSLHLLPLFIHQRYGRKKEMEIEGKNELQKNDDHSEASSSHHKKESGERGKSEERGNDGGEKKNTFPSRERSPSPANGHSNEQMNNVEPRSVLQVSDEKDEERERERNGMVSDESCSREGPFNTSSSIG